MSFKLKRKLEGLFCSECTTFYKLENFSLVVFQGKCIVLLSYKREIDKE